MKVTNKDGTGHIVHGPGGSFPHGNTGNPIPTGGTDPAGRTVILVDDGLATGATMRAAIKALRERNAAAIVVAVPVASESTCRELEPLADRVVCLIRPRSFGAVGEWYRDFGQTSDPEVRTLLDEAQEARAAVAQGGRNRTTGVPHKTTTHT